MDTLHIRLLQNVAETAADRASRCDPGPKSFKGYYVIGRNRLRGLALGEPNSLTVQGIQQGHFARRPNGTLTADSEQTVQIRKVLDMTCPPLSFRSRRVSAVSRRKAFTSAVLALAIFLTLIPPPSFADEGDFDATAEFLSLLVGEVTQRPAAMERIAKNWHPGFPVMMVEVLRFSRQPDIQQLGMRTLRDKTGKKVGNELDKWYEWIWSQPPELHPDYARFKSELYTNLDPVFAGYFDAEREATIRLDEVRWGGVRQDGIPPLRSPKMITAEEATYLGDTNIVFGIEVNGDARAYPQRILAWHEMFVDTVGGIPVAGVYCTLCGTVILYKTEHGGTNHEIGTSGFLYRSNKLMYDKATQSLWSTMTGSPVIGPLVGKGIQLEPGSVVTTRWSEWKRRHPQTKVLSLDTGHDRDYGEGVAYKDYFATDDIMFTVPETDKRLKNKDEVLTFIPRTGQKESLAISARFLNKEWVYQDELNGVDFVVLTDKSGANRAYVTQGIKFKKWDRDWSATDASGTTWTVTEDKLTSDDGRELLRFPAQRAFWFGWRAAYPDTRLVK